MAMLSHRIRRVLVALPSCFQRSYSLSRASDFSSVSSLLLRSVVRQPREFGRSPAKLFSTSQYQYDPYTGEDSFTPDNHGCDFNHWLITMVFPKENPPSREEMISIFEQTCAKGLAISLEEAKKKIYAICTTSYQGFQATMTIGEVEKFRDLPGVQYIIPDCYADVENKVYGGDKYENGVITPGLIPVPTSEGFDSPEKESTSGEEQAQRRQTPPHQGVTSGQVQGSQTPLDSRSVKQKKGTLAPRQGKQQAQKSQMVSFQESFKQGQGQGQTERSKKGQGASNLGQRQPQGSQMPSFQRTLKQGQGTINHGQGQSQGSQPPPQRSFNQGQEILSLGQGKSRGAAGNYSQGPGRGNFIQGTQENYNQMGRGNFTPSVSENYGPAQGTGSPGFGHGQGRGGQGTPMPGVAQGSYSHQGLGAWVPSYHVNHNQWPPQSNFLQGPQHNYNQGVQWHYSPQNSGHYGTAQFGHWYPGTPQCQGNQMPQYQLSYNHSQGTPFPGQWQCQHCGMLQGHGASVPPYHGNYNQGTFANFNQRLPVSQGNYNLQNGGHYGPTHGSAGNPGFGQGFPGHGPNQTFQQEDQRNVAGDCNNNNIPADSIETDKIPH